MTPERLGRRAGTALRSPEAEPHLSPISVWEFLLLVDKGRLEIDDAPDRWVREALAARPLREAPLIHEIALGSRRVSLAHRDPADRFLVATAQVYELTLVTADVRLIHARPCRVLSAR
jgi:PIN domain nuclease of toxin-antitoxin system